MKLKLLIKIIAVALICFVIYFFDWNKSWNEVLVSVLLIIIGVNLFLQDTASKPVQKLNRVLNVISILLAIFLLTKIIFGV